MKNELKRMKNDFLYMYLRIQNNMERKIVFNFGYSYDDILIKPKLSIVKSRKDINLHTKLSKNISLRIPIVSSNMDTVTEEKMAIQMALQGGIGIIHRYNTIDQQVQMVKNVKRYINFFIDDPVCIHKNDTLSKYYSLSEFHKVKTLIVIDSNRTFLGIINKYSINTYKAMNTMTDTTKIKDIMSDKKFYHTIQKDNMIPDFNRYIKLMRNMNVNYLPVLNKDKVDGLITLRDLLFYADKKNTSNLDIEGNLRVGAAIGVNGDYLERSKRLIDAGVDVLVIDIAHGHSILVPPVIKHIKKIKNIDVIAGNVASREGVKFLALAGADGIKVNIGAGSICTTRIVTGCGVPQFTAVLECSKEARKYGIPIIADGGHCGKIGSLVKALSAGASCCMLGRRLAGTYESPGNIILKNNKKYKMIRGMAGYISNVQKDRKMGNKIRSKFTPEGVEGYIEYKGPVKDILCQMIGGIRSGLSYCGVKNIPDLHSTNIEYTIITASGKHESMNHGIKLIS